MLLALAAPILGLKTAMPSIKVLPEDASARVGYDLVQRAFGEGAPGTLQVVVDKADAKAAAKVLAQDPGIAGAMPAMPAADGTDHALIQAVPTVDPSNPALVATPSTGCAPTCRPRPSSAAPRSRTSTSRPSSTPPPRW